jgi:hypothetical protein
MDYVQTQNVGLPTNYSLTNGSFTLVGGSAKVDDNMLMFIYFMVWFRFFLGDFVLDLLWLYQKNSSYVNTYKNIARMKVLDCTTKYAPFAKVSAVDIPVVKSARKQLMIDIQYSYGLTPAAVQTKTIRFVTAI